MGCSRSKLEPDEEAPAALRPVRRRFRDIRRPRNGRMRKDSISTTELLGAEDSEVGDDVTSAGGDSPSPRKSAAHVSESELEVKEVEKRVVVEGGGEKREVGLGFGEEGKVDEKVVEAVEKVVEAVEFPGSPSFRFYFEESVLELLTDGDSVVAGEVLDKPKVEEKSCKREDSFVSLNSSEESESKSPKKDKGRRLKSLKKGPNAVYNLLSSRSCHDNNNHHHSAPSRFAPQPLNEKDA